MPAVVGAGTDAPWAGTEQTGASAYDFLLMIRQPARTTLSPSTTLSRSINGTCASAGSDAGSLLALGTHSSTEGPLAAGSYSFKATYSGDNNYSSSTSSCAHF